MPGKWFMVITLRSPLGKHLYAPATVVWLFVSFHFNTDWSIWFPSCIHISHLPGPQKTRGQPASMPASLWLGFIRLCFQCKVEESLHITHNPPAPLTAFLLLPLQCEENNMLFRCGNPYLETKDCVTSHKPGIQFPPRPKVPIHYLHQAICYTLSFS